MAQSQAHMKATNKYISKTYDQVKFLVPKGQRDVIKAHAENLGLSLNAYINKLIADDMGSSSSGSGAELTDE